MTFVVFYDNNIKEINASACVEYKIQLEYNAT